MTGWDSGSWDDGLWDDGDPTTGLDSVRVEMVFDDDPIAATSLIGSWTDVTSSVRTVTTNRGRDEQWDAHPPGTATLSFLQLHDPRFNVDGLLFPDTPVRVSFNDSSGLRRNIFTGFVQPRQEPAFDYYGTLGTTTVQCYDALGVLANRQLDPLDTPAFGERLSGTMVTDISESDYYPLFPAWQAATIGAGQTILQNVSLGSDALSLFQQIAFSEGGAFWVDVDGTVIFQDRMAPVNDPRLATTQVTFDDTGLTGVRYAAQFNAWHPPVYTSASVTMQGDDQAYAFAEAASVAGYGTVTYPSVANCLAASSTEAQALAERLVRTSNALVPCPKTIRLYPRTNDATLDASLKRELRDRAVFKSAVAQMSTGVNVHVERIQHSIDCTTGDWTCDLSFSSRDQLLYHFDVDDPGWLEFGHATKGLLDGTRGLAW